MASIKVKSYNPFTKSLLGFSFSNNVSNEKCSYTLLDDLDLYHQPLDSFETAISKFVLRLIYLIIGEFVLYKLFKIVRKENGLVNEVTQFYCIVMITTYPIYLLFETITDFIHPLKDIMGQWICSLMRVVFYMQFNVFIFHSFFVALMRYCFIVHEEKVKCFGKQKTKNIFFFLTVFFPILLIVWGFILNQEIDMVHEINSCFEVGHKVFLAELTTGKNLFCVFDKIDGRYGYILTAIQEISCMIKQVILIVFGMNLFEGLLYYKIFGHMTRYDTFNNIS